jgi:hypothetical protein
VRRPSRHKLEHPAQLREESGVLGGLPGDADLAPVGVDGRWGDFDLYRPRHPHLTGLHGQVGHQPVGRSAESLARFGSHLPESASMAWRTKAYGCSMISSISTSMVNSLAFNLA